eukprot:scaffold786_cov315-Chaetoceros_neogracile.AAC.3
MDVPGFLSGSSIGNRHSARAGIPPGLSSGSVLTRTSESTAAVSHAHGGDQTSLRQGGPSKNGTNLDGAAVADDDDDDDDTDPAADHALALPSSNTDGGPELSARSRFWTPPVMPSITSARRMKVTPRADESAAANFYHMMRYI